jgi:hypothetical protein
VYDGKDDSLNPAFLTVLRELHKRLSGSGIDWAVTGSCGFALHGVPIEPNDIDIQTDRTSAYQIERLFAEDVARPVRFSAAERIRSHYGSLCMSGVQVEIMGGVQKRRTDGTWEPPVDVGRHTQVVQVAGLQIPVLSLEYELTAYSLLGRAKKVELLKQHLRSQAGTSA